MNESRTITGLDPVQEVVCELLDIVEKITIDGNTPRQVFLDSICDMGTTLTCRYVKNYAKYG
jgi:hypothetical protein